jgi:SAM-dependent methyltransferase
VELTAADVHYVGHDELVVLDKAVNYNRHIARQFASALPPEGSAHSPVVVDFGAGIGSISRWFRELTGISPVAVELDPQQRRFLGDRGLVALPTLDGLPDGSVDFVFSSNVFEHIENDLEVLQHVHRKLRSGGRVAMWVPAFPVLWTPLDDRVGHFRRYTTATARTLMTTAGFSCRSCHYQDSVGFLMALLFRFFGNKEGRLDEAAVRLFDRWLFPCSQKLDAICSRLFGKNILVVAVKD